MNYFELFNCDAHFSLNKEQLKAIKTQFHYLQKQFHPDRFINYPEKEQLATLQKSSMINDAYKTLIDPVKRGLYLLTLHHQTLDLARETQFESSFLIQLIEWQEEQNDAAIQSTLKQTLLKYQQQMDEAFEAKNWLLLKQLLKQSIMIQKLII